MSKVSALFSSESGAIGDTCPVEEVPQVDEGNSVTEHLRISTPTYFSSMPNNYCQNGGTANGYHNGHSLEDATSNHSNGAPNIANMSSELSLASHNLCAHCSRLSSNHTLSSAPSHLIGQFSGQSENHSLISATTCLDTNSDLSINGCEGSSHGSLMKGSALNGTSGSEIQGQSSENGLAASNACACDWVDLNVGGKVFKTTRLTLSKVPGSFLDCLCNSQNLLSSHLDRNGAFLIDREPEYWAPVLNWLRCGKLIVNDNVSLEGVLEEASFCGLTPLVSLIKDRIRHRDNNTLGHSHVYRILQCKEKELTQTVSTLTDGWKFEQLVNTGTSYRYGDEDQSEFLCVVSKKKQGQRNDDILDQQAQNWQNRQNNLGRGSSSFQLRN